MVHELPTGKLGAGRIRTLQSSEGMQYYTLCPFMMLTVDNRVQKTFSFSSTFMRALLISGGIIQPPHRRVYEIIFSLVVTLILILVFLGSAVGVLNALKFQEKIATIIIMFASLTDLSLHWCVKKHRNPLLRYVQEIQYDGFEKVIAEATLLSENFFREKATKILLLFYPVYGFVVVASLINTLIVHDDFTNQSAYVMPHSFMCTNSKIEYLWITFLCWNVDSYTQYVVLNLLEFGVSILMHLPYVLTATFFVLIQQYLKAHAEVIKDRINVLSARLKKTVNDRDKCGDEKNIEDEEKFGHTVRVELINVIRHYQRLYG